MHAKYLAFMSNLVGIFISGIYLVISCELEAEVGYSFGIWMQKSWVYKLM